MAEVLVLVAAGSNPKSGRARRNPPDSQALELALCMDFDRLDLLHVGDPQNAALREYLGMGVADLNVIAVEDLEDPLPHILEFVRSGNYDLVLAGAGPGDGAGQGVLPYSLAAALSLTLVDNICQMDLAGDELRCTQALPRGQRRELQTRLPALVTVSTMAPAARQSAYARALRGTINEFAPTAVDASRGVALAPTNYRPLPRRLRGLEHTEDPSQRLRLLTETQSTQGEVYSDLSNRAAARKIMDYLREQRVIS